ncbi:hypothetical protein BHS06_25515 [Myxococcus xanthus]|nr:hypothetical protein BHS06_25515 [Myxococcus xanthus]
MGWRGESGGAATFRRFHWWGSSSPMRELGCVCTRSRTSARYAPGRRAGGLAPHLGHVKAVQQHRQLRAGPTAKRTRAPLVVTTSNIDSVAAGVVATSTGFDIPARGLDADSSLNASQHILGRTDTVL